jgi:hypothetical protein
VSVRCSVSGCRRQRRARGLCDLHYRRVRKHDDPSVVAKPPGRSPSITIQPGRRFGRWTVVREVDPGKPGKRYLCACACGTERPVFAHNLRAGKSCSCGCGGRCLLCGRRLRRRRRHTRYCDATCRGRAARHESTPKVSTCAECQRPIAGRRSDARWCSERCRSRNRARKRAKPGLEGSCGKSRGIDSRRSAVYRRARHEKRGRRARTPGPWRRAKRTRSRRKGKAIRPSVPRTEEVS